jgi:hypothetical protein
MSKSLLVFENETATLARGRYAGEVLTDVSDEDPSYLRSALEDDGLSHHERSAILAALGESEE